MYFIQRWREETPLGKRVTAVPGVTVLDWFRQGWQQDDPEKWFGDQLDGDPYGLESIFERAREHDLPRPETMDQLRELLVEHLWVESDDDPRVGWHTVRVRTNDDETDLAYYFVDDETAVDYPETFAFALHDSWPLPGDAVDADFAFDVPVQAVPAAGPGPGAVFSVRLSFEDRGGGTNLDLDGAVMFPGVTLPGLAAHLQGITDAEAGGWPHDAQMLRALAGPGDREIGAALERFARLGGYEPAPWRLAQMAAHAAAHQRALEVLSDEPHPRTLVRRDPHIVQVARYIDDFWGYDQWFLFDSHWAAAHPLLARSLLRWAAHWDPCEY
ncbi:hypothetical protein GCM10010168_24190 [Actinoplanes ianthinogenes]|uniref:Uncharacterized protein n=1 Tax=Actinoplanes ianthinogenes TaxID=122358 RepID=A0ABM7M8X6_9ACTN|nr:hypothetical protein [Actinoplanes ianthinogenes]BCJ48059.1 hypothetical protein Aiant_87160 [Actinoplanes ianthinogenes]GGR06116.1 hypothetical protein GCM10010168_24190 [Actinoplanes ianthinogenes]